jgi:hypothetical protein
MTKMTHVRLKPPSKDRPASWYVHPAHKPQLWSRSPDCADEANPQRRRLKRAPDGRTRAGKEVKALRKELEALHPTPDAVTRAYIDQACMLRGNICIVEDEIGSGRGSIHGQRFYLSWQNAYRRCLAGLRYGDANKAIRQLAEAKLFAAAARASK